MTISPVMTVTDELLAELELLASKATQGEWWIDSHGHTMIATDTLDVVFSMPSTKGAVRHPETGNLSSWRNDWDASYIAAVNPKNMQTILGELRRLRAENAEMAKDAGRLDYMISEQAIVYEQNGTASPTVYSLSWPVEGYTQTEWHKSARDAIDTSMATQQ